MNDGTGGTGTQAENPGRILARARSKLGLSVADVAQELRLSVRQVTALEEGDYTKLPGPTYVRGYLRNYARLLGVAVEEVLPPQAPPQPESAPAHRTARRQVTSRDRPVRLFTYALVAAMITLVVLWWQGRRPQEPEAAPPAAPVSAESTPPAAAPENPPLGPETAQETKRAVPNTPPPAGRARLVLRYREDCWTDIRDRRGERLVYKTVPAGEVLVVEGEPPFRIYLGNAQGVTLQYNGADYDFSAHVRGVFARFTLGEPAGDG